MNKEGLSLIKEQMHNLVDTYSQFTKLYRNSIIKLFKKTLKDSLTFSEPKVLKVEGKRLCIISALITPVEKRLVLVGYELYHSCDSCSHCSNPCGNENVMRNIDFETLDSDTFIEATNLILSEDWCSGD